MTPFNPWQAAIMAPTEILAEQHARSFSRWVAPLGAKVALVTGGATAAERARVRAGLADGSLSVAVGTHALIQEGVDFARLGLVVIDEQHRFGVGQRLMLTQKGKRTPHCLAMTAIPIPRIPPSRLVTTTDVVVLLC